MKPTLRWQLLFAVLGFALVMSILSYHVQYEDRLCTERFPAQGGVFVEGFYGAPSAINPLLASADLVGRQITELVFDGLIRFEEGELVPALAESWTISEDGRTVRFNLREDVIWHDGEPFTAGDVAFTYTLLQDDEFPGDSALKRLWQSIVIRVINPSVIEFELREPYAGFLEATTMGILPAHLLKDVTAEQLPDLDFNHNPIGTGPFRVEPGQDWLSDGHLLLVPFEPAWPNAESLGNLSFRFYPSEEALLEAFRNGEIQAINNVSPALLPTVAQMPEVRLFSAPAAQYTSLLFNMGETGSAATRSREVRRALAYALDREQIVDRALNGQGIVHSGPYLPGSWAYQPEALTITTTRPISAAAGLEGAGWLLPEDAETRVREEEPLILRFLVFDTATNRAIAKEIDAQLKTVGVAPLMSLFSDWRDFRGALAGGDFDLALVHIEPPGDPDLYDFWSQEAIIRGQNYAGWNRRRASEALEDGRQVWEIEERRPHYSAFLRYYDEDMPELALFQHVYTYAVKDSIEGLTVGRIDDTRDRYQSLASWILAYQELFVLCPEDEP